MSVNFTDKKFRSDFKAEQTRILNAIKDCETLDLELNTLLKDLKSTMNRTKGAASLVVRLTEQVIANRNHKLSLIKELRITKKDVIDREIKLAEKETDMTNNTAVNGVNAELLKYFQSTLLVENIASKMLEPDEAIENDVSPNTEETSVELSTEINIGDIVSDSDGNLFIINEDDVEDIGLKAESVNLTPDEGVPLHAILADGRIVLVVEFS
jgi:hypothetical protein